MKFTIILSIALGVVAYTDESGGSFRFYPGADSDSKRGMIPI